MNFSELPIVSEPDQPDNFEDILIAIDVEFQRTGLHWNHGRVKTFIDRLLRMRGISITNYEIARYSLSYAQLTILHKRLTECQTLKQSSN